LIIKNNTTKLLATLTFLLILPFVQKQWLNLYSFNINDISFYSFLYYFSGTICPSLVCLNSQKNYTYYNFNKNKNVLGMMPHPERMIDKYLSGEDGSLFFKNILDNFK